MSPSDGSLCMRMSRRGSVIASHRSALNLSEARPSRMIHNDKSPIRQCFDRMTAVRGHNGNNARLRNLTSALDRDFDFSLDDFVDFFLGMEVLVNRRAGYEVIVCKGHARRVEIPPLPPGKPFDDLKFTGIYKRHGISSVPSRLTQIHACGAPAEP